MILDVQLCVGTAPAEVAPEIARQLVQERLCACVNILPGARSIYRWKDNIEDDVESVLLLKTSAQRALALRDRWVELHPYETPEFIVVPVEGGYLRYLEWVVTSCQRPRNEAPDVFGHTPRSTPPQSSPEDSC